VKDLAKSFFSPPLREKISTRLKESPSPALARSQLARLLDSGGGKSIKKIPADQLAGLFRLLGSSAFLSDILIRQGEAWSEFFVQQITTRQKSAAAHLAELAPLIKNAASLVDFSAGLRRHKQREYLRIGARDLEPSGTLEDTVRELTALAEGSLQAAYLFCRREVEKDFGELTLGNESANRFVVLGMGKLGGGELNFSSDIDVIFLYENDEGESSGGPKGKASPREFFTSVGKKIIYAMGEVTEDGFVFRIDLRLRPMGTSGPLVQSMNSAMLYYESWGQCWERSALIKARPVAGDRELGSQFLKEIEPFIYRRYLDYTTVDELRHMKVRIENELLSGEEKERNIKLGYGGIREVEFFTQALQLVNGGYVPELRKQSTMAALIELAKHGYISKNDRDELAEAYRFLRQVEHKVQIVQEAHAHSIPAGDEEELALARRLGYRKAKGRSEREMFWHDHRVHTNAVRKIFDRLFYGAQKEIAGDSASSAGSVWNYLDREEEIIAQLKQLGFENPAKAYENLLEIRDGEIYAPPSPKRLKIMRALGPALMAELAKASAPDQALLNLTKFSHRIGGRTGFLTLLAENPQTMRLLVTLFADSQFLTDLFLNRPELIDTLIRVDLTQVKKPKSEMLSEIRVVLSAAGDLEEKLNAMRRYKTEEFIRIGLHDLGGALQFNEVFQELSNLADACVEVTLALTLEEIEEKFGRVPNGSFAVIGMGKIGGGEIDYNSDLDLIFIYAAPEDAQSSGGSRSRLPAHEYFVRVGQKLITYLSSPTEEGIAYKIDMQLRPSGKSGPLVSSLTGFREYHKTSSLLWERQALIKARRVAGDRALGRAVEKIAENFAYGEGLTAEGVREIHHLRMRMERELAHEDEHHFNLKKGKGGLVDIEFLTQMLQLTHGCRLRQLRCRETLRALEALRDAGILKKREYQILSDGYLFLRRLDHRLRLQRDQSIDAFEARPAQLNGIAQALGYDGRRIGKRKTISGKKLLQDYAARREKVRDCYARYFVSTRN